MKYIDKAKYSLPFILFLVVVILLTRGLFLHPNEVPSPLINKPAPSFKLPSLYDKSKTISNNNLLGHVTLLNVWASWCYSCREEHEFLLYLSQNAGITLYALNYKDDSSQAKKWLKEYGNPYKLVAVDTSGKTGIDWGVYGTPETFIIDKKGIIRYKQVGPITAKIWEQKLQPLIQQLNKSHS